MYADESHSIELSTHLTEEPKILQMRQMVAR